MKPNTHCCICGKPVYRKPSELRRQDKVYCSRTCMKPQGQTKKCKICKRDLSLDSFSKMMSKSSHGTGKSWLTTASYCKECACEYTRNRRRDVKKQAVDYLGGKCVDCGLVDDCFDVYDFHHRDPAEKDFCISDKTRSLDAIKSELDKCLLLCAVCHRRRHAKNK
jgi:hypothetical protein